MSSKWAILLWIGLLELCFQSSALGMGLRSFVALPVEKGGTVLRGVVSHDSETNINQLTANLAYGIDHKKTLLFGVPYRLSSSDTKQLGDFSLLYRQILSQVDDPKGTRRIGLLGGAVIPTDSSRDGAFQAGTVATWFRDKNEWDIDALYQRGTGDRQDSARYDLSWQHRLIPAVYPEWGIQSEVYGVVELGGRWQKGASVVHQFTLGLQWTQGRWVLEGGVIQDLNGPDATGFLLSIRFH
tara:strand:- start:732 stop:1454 length:723 start_codon:yes stop_codon:yes gene_type:complete